MAFDIWARATAKWRGILVYILLQAVTDAVTKVIRFESEEPRIRLFASLVAIATTVFCLVNTILLLVRDRDGDEDWPPLWG